METSQKLFQKVYEQAQAAGAAGAGAATGNAGASSDAGASSPAGDDVVDGEFKEV